MPLPPLLLFQEREIRGTEAGREKEAPGAATDLENAHPLVQGRKVSSS
jgi:hypothetical protein